MHFVVVELLQCSLTLWHGGAVARASDLRFTGRGFKSCVGTIAQWPCASHLHLCYCV